MLEVRAVIIGDNAQLVGLAVKDASGKDKYLCGNDLFTLEEELDKLEHTPMGFRVRRGNILRGVGVLYTGKKGSMILTDNDMEIIKPIYKDNKVSLVEVKTPIGEIQVKLEDVKEMASYLNPKNFVVTDVGGVTLVNTAEAIKEVPVYTDDRPVSINMIPHLVTDKPSETVVMTVDEIREHQNKVAGIMGMDNSYKVSGVTLDESADSAYESSNEDDGNSGVGDTVVNNDTEDTEKKALLRRVIKKISKRYNGFDVDNYDGTIINEYTENSEFMGVAYSNEIYDIAVEPDGDKKLYEINKSFIESMYEVCIVSNITEECRAIGPQGYIAETTLHNLNEVKELCGRPQGFIYPYIVQDGADNSEDSDVTLFEMEYSDKKMNVNCKHYVVDKSGDRETYSKGLSPVWLDDTRRSNIKVDSNTTKYLNEITGNEGNNEICLDDAAINATIVTSGYMTIFGREKGKESWLYKKVVLNSKDSIHSISQLEECICGLEALKLVRKFLNNEYRVRLEQVAKANEVFPSQVYDGLSQQEALTMMENGIDPFTGFEETYEDKKTSDEVQKERHNRLSRYGWNGTFDRIKELILYCNDVEVRLYIPSVSVSKITVQQIYQGDTGSIGTEMLCEMVNKYRDRSGYMIKGDSVDMLKEIKADLEKYDKYINGNRRQIWMYKMDMMGAFDFKAYPLEKDKWRKVSTKGEVYEYTGDDSGLRIALKNTEVKMVDSL